MTPDHELGLSADVAGENSTSNKRARQPHGDPRYPRKRSLRACLVCRSRKTKCDNVRPKCGFCASVQIPCSYDDNPEKDHSSFDPASLEILRQLGKITESQDELLRVVRGISDSSPLHHRPQLPPPTPGLSRHQGIGNTGELDEHPASNLQFHDVDDWFGLQANSTPSTAAGNTNVAAVRWFDVLTNGAPQEALLESFAALDQECGPLDLPSDHGQDGSTPSQRATRIVDHGPSNASGTGDIEESEAAYSTVSASDSFSWQSPEDITLLADEQGLFETFLRRISSWFEPFDLTRKFSTQVPRLAVRNAGLLNAILALSSYYSSLQQKMHTAHESDQRPALQYYYQTLHYVQKAMQYPSYRNSLELMATTIIISTYEMLHGSSNDWQRHLQGVFWILRSRQIEVEVSSLESTTWWAWLQQDVWAALREKRRTYSTWQPKKACPELNSHELAARALWILAQVVNFCAHGPVSQADVRFRERLEWADQLQRMLQEWRSCLTAEFTPLPSLSRDKSKAFKPLFILPQFYGILPRYPTTTPLALTSGPALAMQVHHVSEILLYANKPCTGGVDVFLRRQASIQESVEKVCGIGLTLTEDEPSILVSQCVFIAGLFTRDSEQRKCVLEMLDLCWKRCSWPLVSLSDELEMSWESPDSLWFNGQKSW